LHGAKKHSSLTGLMKTLAAPQRRLPIGKCRPDRCSQNATKSF
jgi:hypothetical protein